MTPSRWIAATESAFLIVATAGELLSTQDPTLPRPRTIVGGMLFYGTLGLLSSFGEGIGRFAAVSGIVAFLTFLTVGPGGRHLVTLLTRSTALIGGGGGNA